MIYVVVALAAEARPLISHFHLEPAKELEALSVYRRSDLALIVGGVGKEATDWSVGALAKAIPPDDLSVWVNVGVAGHRLHEIGTAVLARKVTDAETGVAYPMSLPEGLHLETGDVRTVSHVETKYETEDLYEMEAAAFCRRATELTSVDLVQVLKIVSDNRRSGTLCISARQVQGLIEDNLSKVDLLVSRLYRHARRLSQ